MRKLFFLAIFLLPSDELILIIALSDDFYFLTYDGEIKRGTDNAKFWLNWIYEQRDFRRAEKLRREARTNICGEN